MAVRKIKENTFHQLSLVHFFEPPEKYLGVCGWVCGYSADAEFLNLAMERFTGKTRNVRARDGVVNLLLLLDKGHSQISPVHVPGVLHAGRKKEQPFLLLHAKLAILLFKSLENPNKFILRLILTTGNWTTQTLAGSLDLVYCAELEDGDFRSVEEEKGQIRADIYAAWDFFKDLGGYFDYSVISAAKEKETSLQFTTFQDLLDSISKPKNCTTRIFDNRQQSLLDQLPGKVKNIGSAIKRNYLAMGSGFYQKPHSSGRVPSIIDKIFQLLQKQELLTHTPEKDIFVNPDACQAVSRSLESLIENKWIIREAADPLNRKRILHAKFIFSAKKRDGYNSCSSTWIYLGSGNLTEAGFTNKISSVAGNLEIGMVLSPGNLYWYHNKNLDAAICVNRILPMDWDDDNIIQNEMQLLAGDGMQERSEDYIATPVAWFIWNNNDGTEAALLPAEGCEIEYQLLDPENKPCLKNNDGNWIWEFPQPSVVKVAWGKGNKSEGIVPVIDSLGRIAGKQLNAMEIDEAWWQLEGYPDFTGEEDDEEEIELDDPVFYQAALNSKRGSIKTQSYPIRKMMELVENIADKQTGIPQRDWQIWCNRLQQCLYQTRDSDIYSLFRKMDINPLSPLRQNAFRPDYAMDKTTFEGKYYEEILDKIEVFLNLSELKPL